jgi:hypothetical protein
MLLNQVNSDARLAGTIDLPECSTMAPVMATPSALAAVGAAGLAKAAGAAVGAGAVTGAAYAAYRAVAN